MVELSPGVYEHLRTVRIDGVISSLPDEFVPDTRKLDPEESHDVLARHIADVTRSVLRGVSGTPAERLDRQREIVNNLVELLAGEIPTAGAEVVAQTERLFAVAPRGLMSGEPTFPERPQVPLSSSALLMNGRHQPQIGHELQREFATAEKVDLLCAFVKWNGIRVLESAISAFHQRGGKLRVITTTYIGATDRRALDRLVELGAEVKISYETRTTRLHAKAWLFHRPNELATAYVGSSNLSRTAMSHGLEWNVRLAQAEQPHLIDTFAATFDDYWGDSSFEDYDPERDRDRVDRALLIERGGGGAEAQSEVNFAYLDVAPHPYQQEVLDELDAERHVHGHWRNLVVMATGTGKTVVAALDYRRLRLAKKVESILFVAHREEILKQSVATFRQVVRDPNFGELFVGGRRPTDGVQHLFASIQSLNSKGYDDLPPDAFDMVIVDEFHHAQADTYRRLLKHLQPTVLLGLTATPERGDGQSVNEWFGNHRPVELRLWEALERNLLAPFQYFGVHDGIDVSDIVFRRGTGYDTAELTRRYIGNDNRVRVVLDALQSKVVDLMAMKAIGFCVSIEHAEYMAKHFNNAGIPAAAVTSGPDSADRVKALRDLRSGELKIIFAVDIFNEGVDVPEIDTVLFLRPTASATIFLQQLGRGLRLWQGKECLTVLDFVGHQNAQFRFDKQFRALTGLRRTQLQDEIQQDFPNLPPGCVIDLDHNVKEIVLRNVQQALRVNWPELATELGSLGDVPLSKFLGETGVEVGDLYKSNRAGWAALRQKAGLAKGTTDEKLVRAFSRMLHIDDPERIKFVLDTLSGKSVSSPRKQRLLWMLDVMLWGGSAPYSGAEERLRQLLASREAVRELGDVLEVLESGIRRVTTETEGDIPLHLHAQYTKDEALAAYGFEKPRHWVAGVRYSDTHKADLFFVTVDKVEGHYSPTTMYSDRAITPELFQWDSQNTTAAGSDTGQRYINHKKLGSSIHLFLRESKTPEGWGAPPYLYAGEMQYVSHKGERPIRFLWKLENPLPADVFHYARAVAG